MSTLEQRIAEFNPDDPEALAALEADLAEEGDDLQGAEAHDEQEQAKPDEKAEQAKGEPSATQQEKPVVKTRDNKHEIPYEVLERERRARSEAEAQLRTLQEQLDKLNQGGELNAQDKRDLAQIDDEAMTAIEQDLPEFAAVIKAQMSQIQRLSDEINGLRQESQVSKQTKEQEVRDQIVAAIDAHPDLSAWREAAVRDENPDPNRWERAVAFDRLLEKDPEWRDRSFADRFTKAAEMVKSFYGETTTRQEKTAEQLKREADAKLGSAGNIPNSLSDIPGGAPPAQSDTENMDQMSVYALGQKFESMTTEQMESYLARFG